MGVPFSSVNCFEGDAPLLFARDGDAMRVPRPAAGMMTVTFMEGAQYTSGAEVVQLGLVRRQARLTWFSGSTLSCDVANESGFLASLGMTKE